MVSSRTYFSTLFDMNDRKLACLLSQYSERQLTISSKLDFEHGAEILFWERF